MSRIEDLIKAKCPNGVEYKKINEVCDGHYGKGNIIPKNGGDYPVYGCNGIVSSTDEYNSEDAPIVGHIGSAGVVTWGKGKHFVTYNGTICTPKLEIINSRYLYYVLVNEHLEKYLKGSQPFLSFSDFEKVKIPVPPLEVQEEIVKILDKFGELEAELEAELEVRKRQYEFWRGKIWNDIEQYDSVCLSELCKIGDGLHGTPDYDENGNYYFINGNNLNNSTIEYDEKTKRVSDECYEKLKKSFGENVILMSINGTIGKVSIYNNESVVLGKSVAYFDIIDNYKLLKKFLFYYLQSEKAQIYYDESKTGSTIKNLGLKALREYSIPLPSLEEQERIVNILDKFDKLVNDISEGLPAEIEARKKQYEYYRNKLLSFEVFNEM